MAIRDIAEVGSDTSGNEGDDRSIPSVDPVAITSAAASDDSAGNAPLGYLPNGQPRQRRRRTREQIEADRAAGRDAPRASPSPQKGSSLSVNSIQFGITGIHALLAAGMSAPELELTEAEAKTISENIVAVARHYDLQQTQKATDWGNLVISLGIVYGGRIIRISARKNAERAAKKTAGQTPPMSHGSTSPAPQAPPTRPVNGSRPKTDADLALLNEVEQYVSA